jgi:hypothetical protein
MSGGYKWLECGPWQTIADEDGLIIAHIVIGPKSSPVGPVPAYVANKFLGNYMSIQFARLAVEEMLSMSRSNAGRDSGRVGIADGVF